MMHSDNKGLVLSPKVSDIQVMIVPIFKTDDEKKCAYCPYRSFCNRGEKAGISEDLDEDASAETEISLEQIAEIEY